MHSRLLGALGIVGAIALSVAATRYMIAGQPIDLTRLDSFDEFMYALWGCGLICTFWLFYRHGATGANQFLRIVPVAVVVGGVAMAIGSLLDIAGLARPDANPLFLVAWPLVLLGTTLTTVLAAGRATVGRLAFVCATAGGAAESRRGKVGPALLLRGTRPIEQPGTLLAIVQRRQKGVRRSDNCWRRVLGGACSCCGCGCR